MIVITGGISLDVGTQGQKHKAAPMVDCVLKNKSLDWHSKIWIFQISVFLLPWISLHIDNEEKHIIKWQRNKSGGFIFLCVIQELFSTSRTILQKSEECNGNQLSQIIFFTSICAFLKYVRKYNLLDYRNLLHWYHITSFMGWYHADVKCEKCKMYNTTLLPSPLFLVPITNCFA